MTLAGRVEAKIVVPTGGADLSVSSGAYSSAQTVTLPAGSYYHTAAGGVSSIATELQSAINDSMSPYPQTAAAMAAAVGFGDWANGAAWLFQESSGNLSAVFGSPTLTATSLTYANTGPGVASDRAIGFDASTDNADGGDVLEVAGTDDLLLAAVFKYTATPTVDRVLISKVAGSFANGWAIATNSTNLNLQARQTAGSFRVSALAFSNLAVGEWYALLAYIDRAGTSMRLGVQRLTTGAQTLGSSTTPSSDDFTTAASFRVGGSAWVGTDTAFNLAALYAVSGSGIATGLTANFATALASFANAVNSSFSVSMSSTTGLYTVSNSFWPCSVSWTSTTLRDTLGFEYDFDYPQTAAQMAVALQYGTWTGGAGYLCNESSGNLASVFGTPATLAAVSSPTYSNQGARGGLDKAIGFDSANDGFDGGDSFDATGTDDIIVAWVARFSAAPAATRSLVTKVTTGAGWQVNLRSDGTYYFQGYGSGPVEQFQAQNASIQAGHWHVGIAVLDRSTGKACVGTKSLLDGTSSLSSEVAALTTTMVNAVNFRIGERADTYGGAPTTGVISAVYVVVGSGVATGLSANLSTALTSFATYMKSQTGTEQAEGLWFPDCTINLESDPAQAPLVSDLRTTQSPTGVVLGLSGNTFYRHRGVVWSHVPKERAWESAVTYSNASWQHFFRETQLGLGASWFEVNSPIQIYCHDGTVVGSAESISGWNMVGVGSIEPKKSAGSWTGLWRIEIPTLISNG